MVKISSNLNEDSEIAKWFGERNILITGGSGFIGKALVEKILRSCPPQKLYLFMRPKKNKNANERLKFILNNQLFDAIRENFSERFDRIHVIEADILLENLGLSQKNRLDIIKDCNVIFHCAGNVKFNLKMKDAIETNVLGTKKILTLSKDIKNLEIFVYVSTAYTQGKVDIMEEILYPAEIDPEQMINITSFTDENVLECLTPKLIGELPNTYSYSKSLSEHLVANHSTFFPVVIARPPIVASIWKDPLPGWTEGLQGINAIYLTGGKGLVHVVLTSKTANCNVIPIDVCNNALIATAWKHGKNKEKELTIVNISQFNENVIIWKDFSKFVHSNIKKYPFTTTLWYPSFLITTNYRVYVLGITLLHFIPAYLIDLLAIIMRKKPFLVQLQKTIKKGMEVSQKYTIRDWKFKNDNFKKIPGWLSSKDKDIFYTDMTNFDWDSYFSSFAQGIRKFYCKEDPSTIPRAKIILKRMYYLDRAVRVLFSTLIFWIIWRFLI